MPQAGQRTVRLLHQRLDLDPAERPLDTDEVRVEPLREIVVVERAPPPEGLDARAGPILKESLEGDGTLEVTAHGPDATGA